MKYEGKLKLQQMFQVVVGIPEHQAITAIDKMLELGYLAEDVEIKLTAPRSEYSLDFLQGMINRMIVSYYKYGKVADAYPASMDAMASLQQRITSYLVTENTEFLIDAANFAMIEFMHPGCDNAHYTPTDSDGSPGRTTTHGIVTHESNTAKRDRLYRRAGD
jgi:hypothetical protein